MSDTGRPGGYPEVSLLQIKKHKKKTKKLVNSKFMGPENLLDLEGFRIIRVLMLALFFKQI